MNFRYTKIVEVDAVRPVGVTLAVTRQCKSRNNLIKCLIVLVSLLCLLACEQKTDLVFNNLTDQNLYYHINNGHQITLPGRQSRSHTMKIGKKYLFDEPTRKVSITVEGETFQLDPKWYEANTATITLRSDKNGTFNFNPTHAGFKLKNNSPFTITQVRYVQVANNAHTPSSPLNKYDLLPQDVFWCRIPHNTDSTHNYYYRFEVFINHEDYQYSTVGDFLKLGKGEQYYVEFEVE